MDHILQAIIGSEMMSIVGITINWEIVGIIISLMVDDIEKVVGDE